MNNADFMIYKFIACCLIMLSLSCKPQKEYIYNNEEITKIQEISKLNDCFYCMVIVAPSSNMAEKFQLFLDQNAKLKEKSIFNFINVEAPENKWIKQWLCPVTLPVTCVFNSAGKLVNLINGCTYEGLAQLKKNIIENKNTIEYEYVNRFKIDKEKIVSVMGNILQCKLKLDKGENIENEINQTLTVLKYPYNLGLKLKNEQLFENDSVKHTSSEILQCKDLSYILLFDDLFMTAQQVYDSNFNINNAQNIKILSDSIFIDSAAIHEPFNFKIAVKNEGDYLLTIYDVILGCGCLKYCETKDRVEILPKETINLQFQLTPDARGDIFRTVYIISDSKYNNTKEIKIYASVK